MGYDFVFTDTPGILHTLALWQIVTDVIGHTSNRPITEINQSILDSIDALIRSGNLHPDFKTKDLSTVIAKMIEEHPGIQKPVKR